MVGKATLVHTRLLFTFEIQNPFQEEMLIEELTNHHYHVSNNRVFRQGPIEAMLLQIAMKDGVSVVYAPYEYRSYVGVEAREYSKTRKYFHELKEILEIVAPGKIKEADIDGSVVYHVHTRNNPRTVIEKIGKPLSTYVNGLIPNMTSKLDQCTFNGLIDGYPFKFNIAPLYSTQTYYYMRFSYRHELEENVEKILKTSKDIILEYQVNIENAK